MAGSIDPAGKVGYKQAPVEHRFRKGKSGNPKGRPRKSATRHAHAEVDVVGLNADDVLLEEAYRPIQVREGDRVRTMSALAAVCRGLATAAMKGDRFARKLFTESVRNAEARKQAELREMIEIVADYQARCYAEFREADARGIPRPEFVPHPDDWVLGPDGMPDLVGPTDTTHKARWDEARRRVAASDEEIAFYRKTAASDPEKAPMYHDEIMREEQLNRYIDYMLPDEATRRRHGYIKPTREMAEAYRAELKRRYRLFAELSPDEQEQALRELAPARRRGSKKASSS